MYDKPYCDDERIPDEEPLADYSLTLEVTSGAAANGSAANTARATLKTGNIFLDNRVITFELTGSARFTTNNEQEANASTNSLGVATINFISDSPGPLYVYSIYTPLNGEEILARKISSFESASPPILILDSIVDQNNAYADGSLPNTIIYTVSNAANQPVSNELIHFDLLSGAANLLPAGNSRTDSEGMLTLYIYPLVPGPVQVRAYLADQPNIYRNNQVNFRSSDILTVNVISDNVPAEGTTPVQLLYQLLNSQGQPVIDTQLGFKASGNAMLPSGGYTNNNGQISLSVTNFTPQRVTVTCYLISDPFVAINTDVTFVPL